MKKQLLITLLVIISYSGFSQSKKSTPTRDSLTVKFTLPEVNYHLVNISNIEQYLDKTNLPHSDLKQIFSALDSLRNDILKQVQPQLQAKK